MMLEILPDGDTDSQEKLELQFGSVCYNLVLSSAFFFFLWHFSVVEDKTLFLCSSPCYVRVYTFITANYLYLPKDLSRQ